MFGVYATGSPVWWVKAIRCRRPTGRSRPPPAPWPTSSSRMRWRPSCTAASSPRGCWRRTGAGSPSSASRPSTCPMIEEATAFARQRQAYGRPIFDYQGVQFMLADSLTELWAARLMTYQTAHGLDADLDVKVQHAQCSMAKLYASEMAGRVADRAVQVFGGRGYMRENVAERFYRELRVDRIWEGTSEIQRAIIADQLAKRGVGRLTG